MADTNLNGSGSRELADFAHRLGLNSKGIQEQQVKRDIHSGQVALIPEGMKPVDLKPFIPAIPERKREKRCLVSAESFIAYVNEQKRPESRIFAQIESNPVTFTAIIDHHQPTITDASVVGNAGWGEQVVELSLKLSREFRTWAEIDGKMMKQGAFVEFLKDNRLDIATPSGAEILRLCMELEATQENRCVGKAQSNRGQTLTFDQDVKTNVTVPDDITLFIPLFAGMDCECVKAEFRFRIADGGIAFGVRLLGKEKMLYDAVNAAREKIAKETGIPVFV